MNETEKIGVYIFTFSSLLLGAWILSAFLSGHGLHIPIVPLLLGPRSPSANYRW